MGIGALRIQRHRLGLIGDGRFGIAERQTHVAAVAPGGGIPRRDLEHLIPQGQGTGEIALTAGAQGLIKQLRQRRRHRHLQAEHQGQQSGHHNSLLMPRWVPGALAGEPGRPR